MQTNRAENFGLPKRRTAMGNDFTAAGQSEMAIGSPPFLVSVLSMQTNRAGNFDMPKRRTAMGNDFTAAGGGVWRPAVGCQCLCQCQCGSARELSLPSIPPETSTRAPGFTL
eukprot:evm.model.scf_688.2 EVM.evm.TU.scf_688.2   scf_688:12292-12627(+)